MYNSNSLNSLSCWATAPWRLYTPTSWVSSPHLGLHPAQPLSQHSGWPMSLRPMAKISPKLIKGYALQQDKVLAPCHDFMYGLLQQLSKSGWLLLTLLWKLQLDTDTEYFNFYPHKTYWQPDATGTPERVYSELYNSDMYIEEHECIRSAHGKSAHETVIAAVMLWSDSTQLANFGTASLWPILCTHWIHWWGHSWGISSYHDLFSWLPRKVRSS